MKLEIELPKDFMNVSITKDNYFIADTNDDDNWDTLKFPLPTGIWTIYSVKNKQVILQKVTNNMKNPNDRYGGC